MWYQDTSDELNDWYWWLEPCTFTSTSRKIWQCPVRLGHVSWQTSPSIQTSMSAKCHENRWIWIFATRYFLGICQLDTVEGHLHPDSPQPFTNGNERDLMEKKSPGILRIVLTSFWCHSFIEVVSYRYEGSTKRIYSSTHTRTASSQSPCRYHSCRNSPVGRNCITPFAMTRVGSEDKSCVGFPWTHVSAVRRLTS